MTANAETQLTRKTVSTSGNSAPEACTGVLVRHALTQERSNSVVVCGRRKRRVGSGLWLVDALPSDGHFQPALDVLHHVPRGERVVQHRVGVERTHKGG